VREIVNYGGKEKYIQYLSSCGNQDSLLIATRLQAGQLKNQGLIHCRDKRFFSSPQHLDWLWGPPSFLSIGYKSYFPGGIKLIINLHLLPRLRVLGTLPSVPHTPSWCGA
jgi:hypothetical protein